MTSPKSGWRAVSCCELNRFVMDCEAHGLLSTEAVRDLRARPAEGLAADGLTAGCCPSSASGPRLGRFGVVSAEVPSSAADDCSLALLCWRDLAALGAFAEGLSRPLEVRWP